MTALVARPSMFFAVPLLLSVVSAVITFDMPPAYLHGLGMLVLLALLSGCIDAVLRVRLPTREAVQQGLRSHPGESAAALALAWLVLAACAVDLTAFPLPLLNPSIYADFGGGRSYVRHISNMCWILPVVGLLCARRKSIRVTLVLSGILFPILVLDRNRLFASMYAVMAVMIVLARGDLPWKKILLTAAALLVLFGQLGKFRSGNLEWISLPFSDVYQSLSPGFKWILLYVGSGVYNFSAIEAKGYRHDDPLVNQLVPGAGSLQPRGTAVPFDEPVINVGTEYFPFLMAFGPIGALLAGLVLYLALVVSVLFFRKHASLFAFLVFLRLSYVCLMAGFAPQAYTWTNFGFLGLCLGLLVLSTMLPRTLSHRHVQAS